MEFDFDSALGTEPKCDICNKPIQVGETVKQTFWGKVVHTYPDSSSELGIKEESYSLIHVSCERKMN